MLHLQLVEVYVYDFSNDPCQLELSGAVRVALLKLRFAVSSPNSGLMHHILHLMSLEVLHLFFKHNWLTQLEQATELFNNLAPVLLSRAH